MTIDVVVADDLTGTSDTAVQFVRPNARTIVFPSLRRFEQAALRRELPEGALTVGVCTESRHVHPGKAAERVGRAHRAALRLGPRLLFQKVDSAMRGNPGAELAAYRRATRSLHVLLSPAFLPSGRTVRDGVLYVNGVSLSASEVGRDLRSPMDASSLPVLLARQTNEAISVLPHQSLGKPWRQWEQARAIGPLPAGIVVADAESERDLEELAVTVLNAGLLHGVSGSAGLAGRLSSVLGNGRKRPLSARPSARRILVVFGSPHPMAVRQLSAAHRSYALPVLRLHSTLSRQGRTVSLIQAHKRSLSLAGISLLAPPLPATDEAVLSPRAVALGLARIAKQLVGEASVDCLVLSGGDIAAAVCEALAVEWIELADQMFPGAPLGRIHGGIANGMWIVTKSGAHGDERGLVTILEALRGEARPKPVRCAEGKGDPR